MGKVEIKKHRLIKIENGVIGPADPKTPAVNSKKVGDYPAVPKPIVDVALLYSSPRLMGPPLCDELVALVEHMFTEEEASVFRHLKPFSRGQTAAQLAKSSHRPVSEIAPIMQRLSSEKRYTIARGEGEKRRYLILPIVPGAFEAVMMRTSTDTITEWHREFARRFEDLFETGYLTEYNKRPSPLVRYLPVQAQIQSIPMAWPSDKLEQIIDRYDSFSVGLCQCRMTADIVGKGCGKPTENCVAFGNIADFFIREGMQRRVEKKDILEIKAEAESHGLLTWMFQEDSGKGGSGSCSCCGCCCDMLRSVTEWNAPGFIAPPHFIPKFDDSKCNYCAKCAKACQMGAITVDTKNKARVYAVERCVGCGLCAAVCDEKKAVEMLAYANFKPPAKSWTGLFLRSLPAALGNSWAVWRERKG